MIELVGAVLSIVVIDLVLSGDNAVVIGMAARRLSPENRKKAILWGGGGAIGLRIAFTLAAAFLLQIPYLRFVGGVLLLWIAWKLVRPGHGEESVSEAESLGAAIRTIVLADVVMSLDNILAVGGASDGDYRLLVFGLLLSIPILLLGSELVARVLGRFPAVLFVGVFVLLHTAAGVILEDPLVHSRLAAPAWAPWAAAAALTALLALRVRSGEAAGEPGLEELAAEGAAGAELAGAYDVDLFPPNVGEPGPGFGDGILPDDEAVAPASGRDASGSPPRT